MRTALLIIFTLCFVGLCKSQQTKPISKDSLGNLLRGTWQFDTVSGRYMTIEYIKKKENSIWTDNKDIVAMISDTNKKKDISVFQIIPNVTDVKISFVGFQEVQFGYPPNKSDTGAGICPLMTDNHLKAFFGIKFPYEIKSISSTSIMLVDLNKSSKKHKVTYKLSKLIK